MTISAFPLGGESDLRQMEALAHQNHSSFLSAIDLPWRMSSWALDDPENARLWRDKSGNLVAWSVLMLPFECLDFVYEPAIEGEILPQILTWMDERSRKHPELIPLGTPEDKPCWFANIFSDQWECIRILEDFGFADQGNVGKYSWSKVFMERPVALPVKDYRIPPGFIARSLGGEREVEKYVTLHRQTFGTNNMTAAWRTRTIRHPNHIPELDVVVAAPDGRLASLCVCWVISINGEKLAEIEPLGCHPDFRCHALGRIALAEALRRLQAHGVAHIYVETDNWRSTAFDLYESMGFKVVRDVRVYRKDY